MENYKTNKIKVVNRAGAFTALCLNDLVRHYEAYQTKPYKGNSVTAYRQRYTEMLKSDVKDLFHSSTTNIVNAVRDLIKKSDDPHWVACVSFYEKEFYISLSLLAQVLYKKHSDWSARYRSVDDIFDVTDETFVVTKYSTILPAKWTTGKAAADMLLTHRLPRVPKPHKQESTIPAVDQAPPTGQIAACTEVEQPMLFDKGSEEGDQAPATVTIPAAEYERLMALDTAQAEVVLSDETYAKRYLFNEIKQSLARYRKHPEQQHDVAVVGLDPHSASKTKDEKAFIYHSVATAFHKLVFIHLGLCLKRKVKDIDTERSVSYMNDLEDRLAECDINKLMQLLNVGMRSLRDTVSDLVLK